MNASDLMIQCLEEEEVKYIFGVPGEENEDFLFALEKSSIIFVPTRHEQGAAFMADIWGRLTGRAGVCLATLGPGATNLLTAVADAHLDKAPLVAITGQGSSQRLHHESHQVIDVVKMMSPITKWNGSINSAEVIPEMVRKAFKVAETEKPGATHLELPEDIAGEKLEEEIKILNRRSHRRPIPDKLAVRQAFDLIKQANQPIIIAGNGAIRSRASEALTQFATRYNIPVANTFMGKGAVAANSDLCMGAIGLGFKDYIIEAMQMADLVITIGYDIAEYDPVNWNPSGETRIVHMDFDPAEVYTHYNPKVEVVGDVASGIQQIDALLSEESKKYDSWYEEIRNRIYSSIAQYDMGDNDTEYNAPGVINLVREILPDSGLVISDVGSHKMWIARNYHTQCPNGCLISNGLATMGISLPGGISAKLVDADRPVVCIMGDGGAMMNIQELETAKRLGVGVTYIILNDNNYGLITWKQERSEGKSFGTELGNPNFKLLAESFGIKGYIPESVSHLREILNHTIKTHELSVIEIPISTQVNEELISELQNYYN